MLESAQPRRQADARGDRLETVLDRLFDRLVADLRATHNRMESCAPRP